MNFSAYTKLATKHTPYELIPAIEKEVLQYFVLSFLQKDNQFKDIVLSDSSAMRLVYGDDQLNEDLTFSVKKDCQNVDFLALITSLKHFVENKLKLETALKTPDELKQVGGYYSVVEHWQLSIFFPSSCQDLPKQQMKIEFLNRESECFSVKPLSLNNTCLHGFQGIIVPTVAKQEVLVDKLIAFPFSKPISSFDVYLVSTLWNNRYLFEEMDFSMKFGEFFEKRFKSQRIDITAYLTDWETIIEALDSVVFSEQFALDLQYVLPKEQADVLQNKENREHIKTMFIDVFREIKFELTEPADSLFRKFKI